jgi:hypothetical protein
MLSKGDELASFHCGAFILAVVLVSALADGFERAGSAYV